MKQEWFLFEKIFGIFPMQTVGYLRYSTIWEDKLRLNCAVFYKHRRITIIYPKERFGKVALEIFNKLKSDPKWYKKINKELKQYSNDWKEFCDSLRRVNFSKLTNNELADLYKKYYHHYAPVHGYGFFGNMLEFEHEYLTTFAKQIIDKRIKEKGLDINPTKTFVLLSTPTESSYLKKEEKELNQLFIKIYQDKEVCEIIKQKDLKLLKSKKPEIYNAIFEHYKEYLWLPYMYEGPAWDIDYFLVKLKQMLEEETAETIKAKLEYEKSLSKTREALIKKLDFNKYNQLIMEALSETVFIKGYRKDVTYFACYVITPFLEEVAKRLNSTLDEVRYFLPEELIKALETGEYDSEILKQRFDKGLYMIDLNGKETFLVGEEAEKKFNDLYKDAKKIENVSELKGSCAYQGYAKGTVKVINHTSEIFKMNKGDIMVSHSTNPNLVPAMEKAAAIITDMGGITCHAAIVSRELQTPCVIGTKIATHVLKDGEEVEVEATNGTVKKIKVKDNWFVVEEAEMTHYLFAASPLRSITSEMESLGLLNFKVDGTEFIKGKGNYVFVQKEWKKLGEDYLKIILNNPDKLNQVNKDIEKFGKQLLDFSQELLKTDFTNKTNQELADLYKQFELLHNSSHKRRAPIWIMETYYEVFTKYMLNYLNSQIKKQKLNLEPSATFAILSTPLKKNFPRLEKEEFLQLAIELKSEKNITSQQIKQKLRKHIDNYKWLPYGLTGPAWNDEHFIKSMKDLLTQDKQILQNELKKLLEEPETIKKQKKEILRKLNLDEKHKKLIQLAEESIDVKASSKDALFFGFYAAEGLLKEIAKRLKINLNLLRFTLPWEIKPFLLGKKFNKEELEERYKYSFIYFENGQTKVFVGDKAREFVKEINLIREEKVNLNVNEIKGYCAKGGYAKGTVKIINHPKDLHKMNPGDILVSRMTDPEIVVAMKKSAAIVTDMGGITCHAAIVSRELGKPCIIGTKIATKVFKDNDLVEVDANKGIIRKI